MSLYQITAKLNGETINLNFTDVSVYFETERQLAKLGFEVDAPRHGYTIHKTADDAVKIANLFCRKREAA